MTKDDADLEPMIFPGIIDAHSGSAKSADTKVKPDSVSNNNFVNFRKVLGIPTWATAGKEAKPPLKRKSDQGQTGTSSKRTMAQNKVGHKDKQITTKPKK